MANKILVTSALPYANGSIHIGHLVEYIQTDIIVRFLKSQGKDAIYCCADDTHGTPIEINASKQGVKPEELIAKYHKEHQEDFARFNIEFESYYSTNSEENKHYAELIFKELKKKDLIYTKEVELTFCEKCKRFLPDRYVKGKCPKCGAPDQYGDVCEKCNSTYTTTDLIDPYCTISGDKPVRKNSKHYFFKLSSFSDKLENWLKDNKHLQSDIKNQVLNWIHNGLEDWCISRDGPYFGFKIPGEKEKYFYVWLDAPIGYISSTENYAKKHGKKAEDWWKDKKSEIYHIIGKDIAYFHLLFWPAILMGAGFNLPNNVIVHGFLTVNKEKMSKSRGTLLSAKEFADVIEPEFLRYYYAGNLSHSISDINLDLDDFKDRINNELVANIANFCYRTLSFINKNFDSKLGVKNDVKFYEEVKKEFLEAEDLYESYELRQTVNKILQISTLGNKYFQSKEPWKKIKDDRKTALETLTLCTHIVRDLAILLKPILPKLSANIEDQLGLRDLKWGDLGKSIDNHQINEARPLVAKITDELKEFEQEEPFSALDLKVAKIEKVEEHPEADKLLILHIDVGKKKKLLAGLKEHYKPSELKGKHIVIVNNLKPRKMRGMMSEGMLLAAQDNKQVRILEASGARIGTQVTIEGIDSSPKKVIEYDEFAVVKLKAEKGNIVYKGKKLQAGKVEISVKDVKDGSRVS